MQPFNPLNCLNDTSSIISPGLAILEEVIFHIVLAAGPISSSIPPPQLSNIDPAKLDLYYPVFAHLSWANTGTYCPVEQAILQS